MEENVDNSGEAFLAFLGLVILGSCANTPYQQKNMKLKKFPPK